MEENTFPEKKEFIKVLNPEKILEFKKNNSSGFDEAEIVVKNNGQDNTVISKIYINNFNHFKCYPNIAIINKNSTKKIKVIVDDKKYKATDSDIFLIISHPIQEEGSIKNLDDKKLNEYFKNNSFKENGQKLYMVGYTKREKEKRNLKNDELIKKIRELEKQAFDQQEKEEENENKENVIETKPPFTKKTNNMNYFYIGLLVLGSAYILYKIFKKNK